MKDDVWAHIGAASGILFVLLLVAGLIFGPGVDPPSFEASSDEVASYVADNRNEIQALTTLEVVAGFAFVLFLGSIALALRSAEGAPGRISAAAFAGGVAFIAIAATGVAAQGAATYHEGLDSDLVRVLVDLRDNAFVISGFAAAALLWFSGVVSLRFGALPFPLGPLSMAGGLYLLVVSIFGAFSETGAFSRTDGVLGFIAFLVLLAWVAATAAALTVKPIWSRAGR